MFGPPVDYTLAQIDQAFRMVPARSLFQIAGLGTVLGAGFDMAFGGSDMRTKAVAGAAFGPIATELDGRGYQFPFRDEEILAAFEDWLAAMATGGPDIDAIPTHRLVSMANTVGEALRWLGPKGDPEITVRFRQVLAATETVLRDRGVVSTIPPPRISTPLAREQLNRDPVPVFIAYSHADAQHRDHLVVHLSPLRRRGKIAEWYDRKIVAGDEWEEVIHEHLEDAKVVLLLVSPNFIASDYCYGKEMRRALERHEESSSVVVPIVVRPTYWREQPFAKLQMLPEDAKPVTTWSNRDNAWVNVVAGIDAAIEYLRNRDQ
jgi:hypothetical protein